MIGKCIDFTDQTKQNELNNTPGPTLNQNGEYTRNQIDVFSQELTNNILIDSQTNPVSKTINKYGDSFYESLSFINNKLNDFNGNYPSLRSRLKSGQISGVEFADFIESYGISPGVLQDKANKDFVSVLFNLEDYYSKEIRTGALASLCTKFESIFGAIGGFFDFLSEIGSLISNILEKIKPYRDSIEELGLVAATAALVKALANEIKERIEKEIDRIIAVFKSVIENLFASIADTLKDVKTFIDELTIRGIVKEKDDACLMFSDENASLIKKTISGAFDYALSLFENPSIAQIEFLVVRICAYLTNIEALFNDVTTPMKQFQFKYKRIANRLATISNISTSTALRAGAIRIPPEMRKQNINKIQSDWEGDSQAYTPNGNMPINPPKPSIEEYMQLPTCAEVKNGTSITIAAKGACFTDPLLGMEGWTGLDPLLRVYLVRLSKAMGGKLAIDLGWVSEKYNKALNASPDSAHLSGLAVDILVEDYDVDKMIEESFKAGFRFVKPVDDFFIHLDVRPLRA